MRLPPDPHRPSLPEERAAGERVVAVAKSLLPWRVDGRLPGYYLDFRADHLKRHVAARANLIETIEEAIDVLSCMTRPPAIPEQQWVHWGQAFQGLSKTPETLLALSGEEFRQFQLAMFEFGNALAGTEEDGA